MLSKKMSILLIAIDGLRDGCLQWIEGYLHGRHRRRGRKRHGHDRRADSRTSHRRERDPAK